MKEGDATVDGRDEFNEQCLEILDFLDTYGTIRLGHLEKFFPGSEKKVSYLIKKRRLYKSPDGAFISTEQEPRSDKCMAAALGVLSDIYEKVKSFTGAAAPSLISFVTHSGEFYEIVYVSYGMEVMVTASFRNRHKNYTDATKRIVIVEDLGQMEKLKIPGTARYALIRPDGSLTYYNGS
jgi:hypothetical protein